MELTGEESSSISTDGDQELHSLVSKFIVDLDETVNAFTGKKLEFNATVADNRSISIRLKQEEKKASIIPLYWQGHKVLGLRPVFKCTWDSTDSFLAVESSTFSVHAQAKANEEPLFRVEYDRKKNSCPSSHFHVHAHRDEVTHLLGLSRKLNAENAKKVKKYTSDFPKLSKIHFPTGGHRFRPCLEDVLESLRLEFNLDTDNSRWKKHLDKARLEWRKIQAAAVVRDSPEVAFDVLVNNFGMPIPENWTCPPDDVSKIIRD